MGYGQNSCFTTRLYRQICSYCTTDTKQGSRRNWRDKLNNMEDIKEWTISTTVTGYEITNDRSRWRLPTMQRQTTTIAIYLHKETTNASQTPGNKRGNEPDRPVCGSVRMIWWGCDGVRGVRQSCDTLCPCNLAGPQHQQPSPYH